MFIKGVKNIFYGLLEIKTLYFKEEHWEYYLKVIIMIGEGNHHASLSRGGGDRTKLRPLTATDINKPEGFVFDLFKSVIYFYKFYG